MIKKILKKYNTIPIIIIVSLFISQPLLWKNFDIYYDDGIQHIARAISTYTSIKNSTNPTVLSNLTNGFGYSWNLFYGPLSSILIIICRLITSNFINGYKLALFLGVQLSRIKHV